MVVLHVCVSLCVCVFYAGGFSIDFIRDEVGI